MKKSLILIFAIVIGIIILTFIVYSGFNYLENINKNAETNQGSLSEQKQPNQDSNEVSDNSGSSTDSEKTSSKTSQNKVRTEPLSSEKRQKIKELLLSNEITKKIPEDAPISIKFFDFKGNTRIWQDEFIIAKGKEVDKKPLVKLTLYSEYIPKLNKTNFCEITKKAKNNKDLGFSTDVSKTKLMWKYKSLLEYRECFGF